MTSEEMLIHLRTLRNTRCMVKDHKLQFFYILFYAIGVLYFISTQVSLVINQSLWNIFTWVLAILPGILHIYQLFLVDIFCVGYRYGCPSWANIWAITNILQCFGWCSADDTATIHVSMYPCILYWYILISRMVPAR